MVTSVQFDETTSLVAWRQQPSSTKNLVCGQIGCYSNCELNHKTNIPFVLSRFFGSSCSTCRHSLRDHRCHSVQWKKVTDVQVLVDRVMKEKWTLARGAEKKREVFIAACRKALNDLDQVMNRATDDLARQVGRHESLALGGSFSAQVGSAVRLLELRYEALQEKKDVDQDQVKKVKASLDRMKTRLAILTTAKENTQKATIRIGS